MNKMNKKGFTLIEMLVVIAIIAVLVAIIIPTVSNATTKAKAATDAANLRAALAEASIDYLTASDTNDTKGMIATSRDASTDEIKLSVITANAPKCKSFPKATLKVAQDAQDLGDISVYFEVNGKQFNIESFAKSAETGEKPAQSNKP